MSAVQISTTSSNIWYHLFYSRFIALTQCTGDKSNVGDEYVKYYRAELSKGKISPPKPKDFYLTLYSLWGETTIRFSSTLLEELTDLLLQSLLLCSVFVQNPTTALLKPRNLPLEHSEDQSLSGISELLCSLLPRTLGQPSLPF